METTGKMIALEFGGALRISGDPVSIVVQLQRLSMAREGLTVREYIRWSAEFAAVADGIALWPVDADQLSDSELAESYLAASVRAGACAPIEWPADDVDRIVRSHEFLAPSKVR